MLRNLMKLFYSWNSVSTRRLISTRQALKMTSETDNCSRNIRDIFQSAIASVEPRKLIERILSVEQTGNGVSLHVGDKFYNIKRNLYVVGFGKAVSGMARVIDDYLHEHIVKGIISIPSGSHKIFTEAGKRHLLLKPDSKIKVYEGAKNNLPDEDAHKAAIEIQKVVKKLTKKDLLLVLISGGGSALQPLPCSPITLDEELEITTLLSKCGANINELNIVRKNIEVLKGGGLVKDAQPAKVVSLIMSDVIGDPLDIICSGPTVPDPSSPEECLQIFTHHNITEQVPSSIQQFLLQAVKERNISQNSVLTPESSATGAQVECWKNVQNVIVGNNAIALSSCKEKAESMGYVPVVLCSNLSGEARDVGKMFARLAKYISLSYGGNQSEKISGEFVQLELDLCKFCLSKTMLQEVISLTNKAYATGQAVCVIAGGETTVNVIGTGQGGRNQEMAVSCALELWELFTNKNVYNFNVSFLSGGTDGQDGPTDAAGGIITLDFMTKCITSGINARVFLENNDTYNLLKMVENGEGLVKTGLTGTNVMDVQILSVEPKKVDFGRSIDL